MYPGDIFVTKDVIIKSGDGSATVSGNGVTLGGTIVNVGAPTISVQVEQVSTLYAINQVNVSASENLKFSGNSLVVEVSMRNSQAVSRVEH
jgi:hypothetical protein